MLIIVCLDDPQRWLARVAGRVTEGGHAEPPERILARYLRTLANLAVAVRPADVAIRYDSEAVSPGTHQALAVCRGDRTEKKTGPLPVGALKVFGGAGVS